MLVFIDIIGQDMNLALIFGEIGCYLFADKCTRQMSDLQRAIDAIMICDCDQRHTPAAGDSVDIKRFSKTFRAANFLQKPL